MKEAMREWRNEIMKEGRNEGRNEGEGMKWRKEGRNEGMKAWNNDARNEGMKEWRHEIMMQGMKGWRNKWIKKLMNNIYLNTWTIQSTVVHSEKPKDMSISTPRWTQSCPWLVSNLQNGYRMHFFMRMLVCYCYATHQLYDSITEATGV